MMFQKVQQRYTRLINTIYFLVLLLTNHETSYNLKNIVLSFHPHFGPIFALFTFTGLWPKAQTYLLIDRVILNLLLSDRGSGPRPVTVFYIPPLKPLSKLWSSQLLKHNEAALELQVGPSSIYKQE